MRSPVTGLIEQYNALTDVEQKVFLDLVDPQPEPEQPKKASKKRGPRSARAEKLSNAITSSREAKAEAPAANEQRCIANVPTLDVECGEPEDALIHDPKGGYASYHKFEPPKPVASVTRRSSRKGAGTKFIPSTAEERANVLSASNGGD